MKKPTLAILVIASAALLGSACGDDPKRPPVAIDDRAAPGTGGIGSAGTRDGGEAGADADDGDAAAACTDLEAPAQLVDQNAITDDPPAGTGGEIVDGIYDLSEARVYRGVSGGGLPGLTGTTYRGSIQFIGATAFQRVFVAQSSTGTVETRSSGTFTLTGTNATFNVTCQLPAQEQHTYSVAGTSVTLTNLVTKESFTFTLRP